MAAKHAQLARLGFIADKTARKPVYAQLKLPTGFFAKRKAHAKEL
jgi:hypothetical protein